MGIHTRSLSFGRICTVLAAVAPLAGCAAPAGGTGGSAPGTGTATATTSAGATVVTTGQPASAAAATASMGAGAQIVAARSSSGERQGILGRYLAELEPINDLASRLGALTAHYPDGVAGAVHIDNATYGATGHNLNTRTRRNQSNNQANRENMDELVLNGSFKAITQETTGVGAIYGSYLGLLSFSEADGTGRGPGAFSAVEMVEDNDEEPMTIECEYLVSRVEPNSGGVCLSSSEDDEKDGAMWLLVF